MKFRGKLGNFLWFSNFYSIRKNILIKGALGSPEGHQVDTRIANDMYTIGKPLKFGV
jgi:hypothetical protein